MGHDTQDERSFHPVHLPSLSPHHRWLMLYGICQTGVAMLTTLLAAVHTNRIELTLPGEKVVVSHPAWVVWITAFLLSTSIVYVMASATRAVLWMRVLVVCIVSALLLYLGWNLEVVPFIVLPVVVLAGYVLWRGIKASNHYPSWRDFSVIGVLVVAIWALAVSFGLRPEEMGPFGSLYLGVSGLVLLLSFLPSLLLLLSGLDLAEMFEEASSKLTHVFTHLGLRSALVMLLILSVVKIGFYSVSGAPQTVSGSIAVVVLLVVTYLLLKRAPEHVRSFEPRFKHWLALTLMALIIPLIAIIAITLSPNIGSLNQTGNVMLAAVGPLWIACALLCATKTAFRPFALFTAISGLWVFLSVGFAPFTQLLFHHNWSGLSLRNLDFVTAVLFTLWSLVCIVKRGAQQRAGLLVKMSLFISGGFVLYQLLNDHIAVAEIYLASQAVAFVVVRHVSSRSGRMWLGYLAVLILCGLYVLNQQHNALSDLIYRLIETCMVAGAIIWDLLSSEHRMGGPQATGVLSRPGRLFLYVGFVTWSTAQFVFAKTGEGTEEIALESLLSFGFVVFGMPKVFYSFLFELFQPNSGRDHKVGMASSVEHAEPTVP